MDAPVILQGNQKIKYQIKIPTLFSLNIKLCFYGVKNLLTQFYSLSIEITPII